MALWTIRWLKRVDPSTRLLWAGRLFWFTIVAGLYSTLVLANNAYEKVLMAISWAAVTITCIDVILTADVRDEAT